jgi:hypothetical protein
METYLIVPAFSHIAGKCRIVKRDGDIRSALANYRASPDAWVDCGLMNSRGELVAIDAPDCIRSDMRDAQPLAAGNVFVTR